MIREIFRRWGVWSGGNIKISGLTHRVLPERPASAHESPLGFHIAERGSFNPEASFHFLLSLLFRQSKIFPEYR